jgi:hypothetical protein
VTKSNVISSGHGVYLEAGINPGKFISDKLILGLYAGWGWRGTAWSTSFSSSFTSDYKNSLSYSEGAFSETDRTIINSSARLFEERKGTSIAMPGCETSSFHNYSVYYGVVIKLPYRYSPVIKLYRGSTRSYYMGNKIVTSDQDYNIFELRRAMHGCEVMFFRGLQLKEHLNAGCLSVYAENNSMKRSELYFTDGNITRSLPLGDFTNSSFLNKYKNDFTVGLRLSFCIM